MAGGQMLAQAGGAGGNGPGGHNGSGAGKSSNKGSKGGKNSTISGSNAAASPSVGVSVSTPGKIEELLDAIRIEFQQVSQEATTYRLQNQKTYDFKINQQLAEMQQIRNTVYELELTHRKMKDAYEEEISRLKVEVEQRDHQLASYQQQFQQLHLQQQHQHQQQEHQDLKQFSNSNQTLPQPPVIGSNATTAPGTPAAPSNPQFPGYSGIPAQQLPGTQALQSQQLQQQPGGGTTLAPLISALSSQLPAPTDTNTENGKKASGNQGTKLPSMNPPATDAHTETKTTSTADAAPHTKKDNGLKDLSTSKSSTEPSSGHYLVPYDQRASQNKPIPPFLLDLEAENIPEEFKKETENYHVLYNPALPRNLDVELLHSLDHASVVCCVKFSNDGKFLATGCNKNTQVYNVATGELVARLSDDGQSSLLQNKGSEGEKDGKSEEAVSNLSSSSSMDLYIRSVCFSPDGRFLATGAEDKLIRIWDIAQRKITMVLEGHEQDIYSLDYFPSGDKLVSGSGDRTVRIWDLRTGQCSLTLSIEDGVTTVIVSPGDGKFVAAGSLDRTVRVWDSETGFLVERLDSENELGTGHKDSVYSVVFTRDGKNVVSASLDRSVKLWNLRNAKAGGETTDSNSNTGNCEVTYIGHKDFVLSVATTQNDEYILSGSKDRGVLFWDIKSGNPLLMLQGHRNSVISVAVANGQPLGPNAGVFATGSGDCKARIWKFTRTDDQG